MKKSDIVAIAILFASGMTGYALMRGAVLSTATSTGESASVIQASLPHHNSCIPSQTSAPGSRCEDQTTEAFCVGTAQSNSSGAEIACAWDVKSKKCFFPGELPPTCPAAPQSILH